jgi:hypothetical protein
MVCSVGASGVGACECAADTAIRKMTTIKRQAEKLFIGNSYWRKPLKEFRSQLSSPTVQV